MSSNEFSCSHTQSSDGTTVVQLRGELDLESVVAARDEIVGVLERGARVIVDLTDVGFMDSSGLGALVFALRRAKAVGATLTVQEPQPWVRKLFESAGVAGLFGLEAAAAPPADPAGPAATATDGGALDEVCTLLHGYENLLRWGDLTPEQVTIALGGLAIADASDDLALAQRVRAALEALGEISPDSDDD